MNFISVEGALCFDESNELVYVNMPIQMIPSGINNSDSLPNSSSVFSSYSNSIPSLSDLPLFNDGGQVTLLFKILSNQLFIICKILIIFIFTL